jgi:hypothetical protein
LYALHHEIVMNDLKNVKYTLETAQYLYKILVS